ncbi:MAG: hypothetical protein H8D23_31805 [Candidatus Brocadiales bacterium]|nr:hypothetical protein [Candidatus Brocadiales bacterium]
MSNIFEVDDEITEIEYIGEKDTIDINVSGNKLFYANDLLTHNSAVEEMEFDHSHISGGISQIHTADNVFAIFTSRAMRERGRYQIQLLKTRSSSGVGQKVDLGFDLESLRIFDLGEDAEEYTPISSITDRLTPGGVISSSNEDVSKVTANVQSNKLKEMLASLKT